jgi:hypothetical protein
MNFYRVSTLFIGAFIFLGCTPKSALESIDNIWTDEVVIDAKKFKQKSIPQNPTAPIMSEKEKKRKTKEEIASTQISKKGRIVRVSYDPDVKLYIYTFASNGDEEYISFFYDKKLPYSQNDIINVRIKDNFLIDSSPIDESTSVTPSQKIKRIISKKRKKSNISEPIEEKINTF